MTTIQDRIIKKFRKEYYDSDGTLHIGGERMENMEHFLKESIKLVELETRKETLKPFEEIIITNFDDYFGTFDVDGIGSDILKMEELENFYQSITNKDKQK